jgi:hypothetical protein
MRGASVSAETGALSRPGKDEERKPAFSLGESNAIAMNRTLSKTPPFACSGINFYTTHRYFE